MEDESEINHIFEVIQGIWERRNYEPINPEQIGYEFSKNNNFWDLSIPIKLSNQPVDLTKITTILENPKIKCFGLCIGIMHEETDEEFIYALGLYQLNVKDLQLDRTMPLNQVYDTSHLTQIILLLCREVSARRTAKIIKHFGFDPEWIHPSTCCERYFQLSREVSSSIYRGENQFNKLKAILKENPLEEESMAKV